MRNSLSPVQCTVMMALLLSLRLVAVAQSPLGSISGRVVDKATQASVTGATLVLQDAALGANTDSAGAFRITGIPLRTYNVIASSLGYTTATVYNVVINAGNEATLNIELESNAQTLAGVIVSGGRRTAKAATLETPLSVQRLTSEEIKTSPGGNFDISKVIQALPGVGGGQAGGGFRNDIIIRGGAPNESVFYLDGIEIPVINHFQTQGSSGGPQGMLNVSFIEDVKLSTSAFDARYDNALSSVFQFRQRAGNPNRFQGNMRLSATELALTGEGPLSKATTFLVSARRSYLQLLFSLIDLPIRPNFWDFQTKVTHRLNDKTTISFIGLGAIDDFKFSAPKDATPDKLYILNANPFIHQWNYTAGITLRRLIHRGYINVALSRNSFDNAITRYDDNTTRLPSGLTLRYTSRETENKLRVDALQTLAGWRIAYGASAQLAEYSANTFAIVRREVKNAAGAVVQPGVMIDFSSPLQPFIRYGAFAQLSRRFFNDVLGISAGLRTDGNTFTTEGADLLQTISPRASVSYALAPRWTLNASAGRYYKLPPYTILGFADNAGALVNRSAHGTRSDHLAGGVEFLPTEALRITLEGFYKKYAFVPISRRSGIALSNLGSDFNVLGNEAVTTDGRGRAYGVELFAQKKLSKHFFGILSYTWYRSEYSGTNGVYVPSSFDNRQLLSLTLGYKAGRRWEAGLRVRYQGGAPYTPYDTALSRINFLASGEGILDYSRLNTQRLAAFYAIDLRIDKKWNFRKATLDVFIDITNLTQARTPQTQDYSFARTSDNATFQTSDGTPSVRPDGSNAVPVLLGDDAAVFTPSIGFIVEF